MNEHLATITWRNGGETFTDGRYSRAHSWSFDGGIEVPASASPHIVPLPYSTQSAIDPEEAFVAALASCHLLWFLSAAAKRGYVVDSYRDEAVGEMGRDARGKLVVAEVRLRPRVAFSIGKRPTSEEHGALHHEAHENCFLANSVRTIVRCEALDVTDGLADG